MSGAPEPVTVGDAAKRRADYLATFDAQRRAAKDPKLMAILWHKLAELDERYKKADAG